MAFTENPYRGRMPNSKRMKTIREMRTIFNSKALREVREEEQH
jgi:hypothetical protein